VKRVRSPPMPRLRGGRDRRAFQFSVPDDWLRTLRVGAQGQEDDHQSEGRKILSDANPLYLRYIFRNVTVASWDTMLVHGVSLLMKAALAYPITKSTRSRRRASRTRSTT
jgi:hypothetical protein